jgi:hypothetical protein
MSLNRTMMRLLCQKQRTRYQCVSNVAVQCSEGGLTLRIITCLTESVTLQFPLAFLLSVIHKSASACARGGCCMQSLNCQVRHPLLIGLNFVSTFLMALGIGAVYWQAGTDTGGIQVAVCSRLREWVGVGAVG